MTDNDQFTPRPEPAGWTLQSLPDTFSYHAGPFYFRKGDTPGVGFYAEARHLNVGGIVHGGALMTLADMSLWDICRRKLGSFKAVTVTVNSEFLGPGPAGEFFEATGEMTGGGRRLLFARGLITAAGAPVMSFSGTLKRLD